VSIDQRDLEDMLGNLLDNARMWARSRVRIDVRKGVDAVEMMIEDDGPGIPQDRVEEVIGHGTRLDRTVPGTGIGLAIVQDLAALHGGSVALSHSPLGGVLVAVRLPSRRRSVERSKMLRPPGR
jgi:signal transduction histidine kinase